MYGFLKRHTIKAYIFHFSECTSCLPRIQTFFDNLHTVFINETSRDVGARQCRYVKIPSQKSHKGRIIGLVVQGIPKGCTVPYNFLTRTDNYRDKQVIKWGMRSTVKIRYSGGHTAYTVREEIIDKSDNYCFKWSYFLLETTNIQTCDNLVLNRIVFLRQFISPKFIDCLVFDKSIRPDSIF